MPAVVWILEDDETLGFFYQAFLSLRYPGAEMRLFTTGEAALTATGVPDIVISDTHLAGQLTGPEAVLVLRKRNSQLATIFCSGLGPPPPRFLGPHDVCLGKPFSASELMKQLNQMLARIPRLRVPPLHPHPHARHTAHRRHHHK